MGSDANQVTERPQGAQAGGFWRNRRQRRKVLWLSRSNLERGRATSICGEGACAIPLLTPGNPTQKNPTAPAHPDTEASYVTLGNLLFQPVSPS